MNILDLIADDNFKYNIKRSMIVKNIKKYDLSEFKIKQKDGCFEIYIKKNGSNKKIKKVYEFKKHITKVKKAKEYMKTMRKIYLIMLITILYLCS
jgi:hypothetical protein